MARPENVPDHLVVDYDAFAPATIQEVRAQIESWRELGPIVWTDRNHGHWIVLSAGHTRTILSDPAGFSSATPGRGVTLMRVERDLQVPIEMDGADHRQYRRIIMPLFSPRRISLLEERVGAVVHELIERAAASRTCDIVADFARPLASAMFLGMMDWPLEDREFLEQLADQSLNGVRGGSMEERAAAKVDAGKRLGAYVAARIEERRGHEGAADDMTTTLINSTLNDGQPIPEGRLLGLMKLLLIAGLDTTQSVLSQTLLLLGSNAALQERVRGAGEDLPRMVEELLRLHGPAMPSRVATDDVEIGGVRIASGDTVHLLLAAANRDEAEFDEPDEVDLDRAPNHLAFSVGPHKCIGAALARLVLAVALREFHNAFPSYRVVDAASHGGTVWGMDRVELELEVAAAPV